MQQQYTRDPSVQMWAPSARSTSLSQTATAETCALASGAVEFCEKPLQPQPFIEQVHTLLGDGPRSTLPEVVSLSGLARIIEMERSNCALYVKTADAEGLLVFVAGDLVDARQGMLTGMLAALEIFGWTEPSVTVDFAAPAYTRTIAQGLPEVLRRSERAAWSARPAPRDEVPEWPPEYCSTEPAPVLEHFESPDLDPSDVASAPADPASAASPASPATTFAAPPQSSDQSVITPDALVDRILAGVMRIDGALGAAVLDWRADRCLGVTVRDGRLDVASAARRNSGFLRATMATLDALGLTCPLQDIVITLVDQTHLFHPFGGDRRLFVYVVVDTTNFALTRHRLARLVPALEI